jgi:hypothetical protein
MIDFNWRGVFFMLGIAAIAIGMLVVLVLSSGCITAAKNTAAAAMATPTPTPSPEPTPTPTPTPTPRQTPKALPTILQTSVDPLIHGERYEGQWFKWHRQNVTGLWNLDAGVIVYRHAWLDKYSWYNNAMGQYYVQDPPKGYRYFVVWIHEEVFGPDDPGMFPFYENAFRLQIGDKLIETETTHNPVNNILEFNRKYDYYDTVIAPPFGYRLRLVGGREETGGYVAERLGEIRMGQGNSVDGYIMFEVPEKTQPEDVILLGNFARYGTAYWRFAE